MSPKAVSCGMLCERADEFVGVSGLLAVIELGGEHFNDSPTAPAAQQIIQPRAVSPRDRDAQEVPRSLDRAAIAAINKRQEHIAPLRMLRLVQVRMTLQCAQKLKQMHETRISIAGAIY